MLIKTTNKFSLSVVIIFLLKQHFNINKTSVTVLRWVLKVETWKCFFLEILLFFLVQIETIEEIKFQEIKTGDHSIATRSGGQKSHFKFQSPEIQEIKSIFQEIKSHPNSIYPILFWWLNYIFFQIEQSSPLW